jgi:RNA polymerase sigma factor (sigma-70 family)
VAVDVTAVLPGGDPTRFIRNEPDEALVALVLQGSEAAFEAIYDRHHRGLIAFCRHMLRSREEAEDALQHTFAAAYRSLTSGGDRPAALKPWLYTIARNRCLTVLRARKTRDEAADAEAPSDGTVVEGLTDAVQRRADLRDLVADLHRLPEDQRAAIVLFEMGDQSHAEIAEVLDINREKVKALVFQAREGLMRARTARDTPCAEIRQHLSSRTRALPRRGVIRGHLENCAACAAYDLEVRRQRAALAIALPVIPSLELKGSVLGPLLGGGATVAAGGVAAIGTGAAGTVAGTGAMGAGAAGAGTAGAVAVATGAGGGLTGGAAMGGLGALAANAVVAKVVTVVAVAGAAAGAGHAIHERHDGKLHRTPAAKAVVVANSKPAPPPVVPAPAPPAREVGAESTTAIPHQVSQTQTVHTTPASDGSSSATTATTPEPATSPASSAHQPAGDPSAPATSSTAADGTAGGTSAPASDPAPPADAGASGSAPSTTNPPDTTTPPAGSEPIVMADALPPDDPAAGGTAVDPATGAPVECPPGTGPASIDPNASPPPVPPSTDPATAPPVPTVTLPDGTVTPIPAGCALLPTAAGTTAQDPAVSAAVAADAPPAP